MIYNYMKDVDRLRVGYIITITNDFERKEWGRYSGRRYIKKGDIFKIRNIEKNGYRVDYLHENSEWIHFLSLYKLDNYRKYFKIER